MYHNNDEYHEEFRPRLIIWSLTASRNGEEKDQALSTNECMVILDSIARLSKPIVILTGPAILHRPDIYEILAYGYAVGLKVIIESDAVDITEDVLRKLHSFGPRVLRVAIDDLIREGNEDRYETDPGYLTLEKNLQRLKEAGFEIHLCITVNKPDERNLAFNLDFALRHSARGLYCHLSFDCENGGETVPTDQLIMRISELKRYIPENVYFSPQCLKYGLRHTIDGDDASLDLRTVESDDGWTYWCLAGRTFAHIDHVGVVHVCAGQHQPCGNLRSNGYDFKEIWDGSEVYRRLRTSMYSCSEIRMMFGHPIKHKNTKGHP